MYKNIIFYFYAWIKYMFCMENAFEHFYLFMENENYRDMIFCFVSLN